MKAPGPRALPLLSPLLAAIILYLTFYSQTFIIGALKVKKGTNLLPTVVVLEVIQR